MQKQPQRPTELAPQFPLYIPSKGRAEYMITSKALTQMGIDHFIVVEPQEVAEYRAAVKKMALRATIIALDMSYKEKYELCDDLGLSKSTGPGPARNFIWDHSIAAGHKWHWVMDDNIKYFCQMRKNDRIRSNSKALFRAMEDFVLRYTNVAMAGPAYMMFGFCEHMERLPPFITNTRIYSCNLIRNDVPFRWRGRYNEDTILSLDMLKAKWCTIQFNAFLQNKIVTQALKGGNTDEFYHAEGQVVEGERYAHDGTLAKSRMQVAVHPDVSRLVWKFGRWHHAVKYSVFKKNKLIRKVGLERQPKVNNYGVQLRRVAT